MFQPSLQRQFLTHEEYFALEQAKDWRYEHWRGEVFAMAGGSPDHASIAMSTGAALLAALRGRPARWLVSIGLADERRERNHHIQ